MMKKCTYCGNQIHENASFCPYCMKSQIEKQNVVIQKRKSKKWLCFSAIGIILIAFIAIVVIHLNDNHQDADNPDIPTETMGITTTKLSTTMPTETQTTTVTSVTTTETSTTDVTSFETTKITTTTYIESNDVTYQVGDYITEGKSISQIQGYGGYEDVGGTILEIEEISENAITFSIIKYSESGLPTDTISARNINAEIIDNKADFKFTDMLDGHGTGTMTFENGKIHVKTWSDDNSTSIIVDEYLFFNDIV